MNEKLEELRQVFLALVDKTGGLIEGVQEGSEEHFLRGKFSAYKEMANVLADIAKPRRHLLQARVTAPLEWWPTVNNGWVTLDLEGSWSAGDDLTKVVKEEEEEDGAVSEAFDRFLFSMADHFIEFRAREVENGVLKPIDEEG